MDVKNLETAERFAKKRRALQQVADLLSNYVHSAKIKVVVDIYDKPKEAVIQDEIFNALMYNLVNDELMKVDEFVRQL